MKNVFYALLLSLAFYSCKGDGVIDKNTMAVKEFPDSVRKFEFKYEMLPIVVPRAMGLIKEDSLFVFIQPEDAQKLHIYRATDYHFLGAFITKGRGPNEVLMMHPLITQVNKVKGEMQLIINSYPEFIALFNVTQSLQQQKTIFDKRFDFVHTSTRKKLISESKYFQPNH